MELTHQQKLVAAAMNAKGQAIDEIVAKTQADKNAVEEFVTSRNRNVKRKRAEELRAKGVSVKDISKELSVSQQTVYNWTNGVEPKAEAKSVREPAVHQTTVNETAPEAEKIEPAPAEAETSPKEKYLQEYNTSVLRKSQEKTAENLQRIYMRLSDAYEHDLASNIGIRFFGEAMGLIEGLINDLKVGEQA